MPDTYAYKVRDKAGKVLEGTLESDSTVLVANRLRQMGYVPISIDKKNTGMSKELTIPGFGGKAKLKDISIFSRQFATMMSSGLTLLRSLNILEEQTENKALAKIIAEVRADVEKGMQLSQALGRHPRTFNRLFVAMVRAGEVGGVLESVLEQLAGTIEKQAELRGKLKSAMTYPIAVVCIVVLIVTAMLIFVVPTFQTLYTDLGGTLPLPTRLLLAMSAIVVGKFIYIAIFIGASIFGFKRWVRTEKGKATFDAISLKIPLFGKLVHKTAVTRFARTLSVLQQSGVQILESLEITADTVNNAPMAKGIHEIQDGVKQGENMAKAMGANPIFPPMVTQMTAVGEETGAIDHMLAKVADFYEAEVEAMVDAMTSLLEPLMTLIIGGTVGSMVIALYMPMFNIINLIQ
jgi:type IV pilus assembly protein PilC